MTPIIMFLTSRFPRWHLSPLNYCWIEPIANVANRLNQAGLSGISFNFFAQGEDVSVNRARVVNRIRPGAAQEFRTTQGQSLSLRQHVEQTKFLRREVNKLFFEADTTLH